MGLIVATTFALCLWLVLWSLGTKAIDGMILTVAIIMVAAGVRIAAGGLLRTVSGR